MGYTGDHAVYSAGQTVAGTAVFRVNPAPPQTVPGVYVEGATAAGTLIGAGTITAGQPTFFAAVTDNIALPASQTQFYNPLNTGWSVGQAGGPCATEGCAAAGTSSNPVYVTLAQSVLPAALPGVGLNPVMLTYVALAVGSGGAANQPAALANTWTQFSTGSGPANVLTWDGRAMFYYSVGFNACALNAVAIVQTSGSALFNNASGQCGAFAWLLESALAMNGIHSNWTQVQPTDGSLMVIKNWSLGTPTLTSPSPWLYNFLLSGGPSSGIDYMDPPPASYGDLTNCTGGSTGCNGLPGQGLLFPLEKAFNRHFIVQAPTASGNQYFDPSYGVTYPSAPGFETQSVAGYAAQFGPLELGTSKYQFRPAIAAPYGPNISFSTVSANSM
jgi:hypothetical protein